MISVVVVDFLKGSRCANSVRSLLSHQCNFEIVLVDNSVSAENEEFYREFIGAVNFKYIRMTENVGYTKGCNVGAEKASGSILVFMSPDVMLLDPSSFLNYLDSYCDSKSIIGFSQVNDDGHVAEVARNDPRVFEMLGRKFFGFRSSLRFEVVNSSVYRVDWVQSSLMAISKDFFAELCGFDERYFLFMADVAICQKCRDIGGSVLYVQEILASADGIRASGGGGVQLLRSRAFWIHIKDALSYFIGKVC